MAIKTLQRQYLVQPIGPGSNEIIVRYLNMTDDAVFNQHQCSDGQKHDLLELNLGQLEMLVCPRGTPPEARFKIWCRYSTGGQIYPAKLPKAKSEPARRKFSPQARQEVSRMMRQPGMPVNR